MTGRYSRRRDQGRVIIAPAESRQRARDLADAYRYALRDLMLADRSHVETVPGPDGDFLVYVSYSPGPG